MNTNEENIPRVSIEELATEKLGEEANRMISHIEITIGAKIELKFSLVQLILILVTLVGTGGVTGAVISQIIP